VSCCVKTCFTYLLLALVLLQTFSRELLVVDFALNRATITARFCVNKARPALHCDGKCYFAKKLKQQEDRENKAPSPLKERLEMLPATFGGWQAPAVARVPQAAGRYAPLLNQQGMKLLAITAGLAVASFSSASAQQATLHGTVLDAQTQQALPGVTVVVPGTSLGTTTDAQGRFELLAASAREVTITFIGYNAQKLHVPAEGHPLTVRLEAAPVSLQGVVVSASREQEKRTEAPVAI
nr:hypothetical protein [Tanacetum cinerariifolium]